MTSPVRIALLSRLYETLARRPDLLYADQAERVERVTNHEDVGPLPLLDVALLSEVKPIDRLCASAVVQLKAKGAPRQAILDLLAVLDADRLVAIASAVPEDVRRRVLRADPRLAGLVREVEQDMGEARFAVESAAGLSGGDGPRFPLDPDSLLDKWPKSLMTVQ